MTFRIAGLVCNFVANAVLLYGLSGYITDKGRLPALLGGCAVTLLCLVLLSRPRR